uniref:Chitin-binding type-2 domain-containing protein n=1 Tax=Elaeophora elaphi TaxID=1147741 RepID=A0A0R3RPP3_9BILA
MNCTGMKDGNYPAVKEQCSKYFWRCSNGGTSGGVCRDGLYFNAVTKKCDTGSNIKDCPDGCPEDQVYNAREKKCDVIELVPECTTATVTSNRLQISKLISAPELDFFCNTTGDGLLSAGCENYFYFCASGHGYHVKCPEGFFFDSETRTCNHKEHVLLCNLALDGSRTMANEQAYAHAIAPKSVDQDDESKEAQIYDIQTRKETHSHADHIPEVRPTLISVPISKTKPLPVLSEDFDCQSKADGFYSIGCKTEFVACANHWMFFLECPQSLIFNEEAQICDYEENIEKCSKMADLNEKESFLTTHPEMEREISSEEESKRMDGVAIRDQRQIINPISKTCSEPENIPECVNKHDRT